MATLIRYMCVMFRLGAQESKELISLCTNLTVRLNLISTLHTTLLSMSCKCCSLCSTKGGTHVENKGVTCDEDEGVSLVQTVRGNYEGYTKQEVLKAKEARRTEAMMGNPSEGDYKGMVSHNLIPNCPVTSSDITNAKAIFGPDLPSVRGKTV